MSNEKQSSGDRIVIIDALRGFALLGILLTHFNHWYVLGPLPDSIIKKDYGLLSTITETIITYFVSNKFYILFSFIFGLSFYLQTVSFVKYTKNIDFVFVRRAFFLFVIGAIHYSIWLGDILAVYALLMIPLLFLRKLNQKYLLAIAAILVLNIPVLLIYFYRTLHGGPPAVQAIAGTVNPLAEQLFNAVTKGNLMDCIKYNISFIHTRVQYQIWSGTLFMILGFFILGMITAKNKWLLKISLIKDKLKYFIVIGIVLLAGLQLGLTHISVPENDNLLNIKVLKSIIIFFQSIISVMLNISIVAIMFYNNITLKLALHIAELGKMALTNYLIQTIIGMVLYFNIGFGVFGKTTPGENFLIALGVYVGQLFFSYYWLMYFNYGFVEWLLRAGTLWEFKDLKKKKAN